MINTKKIYEISIADDDIHSVISEKFDAHSKKSSNKKSESSSSSEEDYDDSDNKVISIGDFNSKETCCYKDVDKYFKKSGVCTIKKMIDIIEKESDISLRILDWFVTRYSHKNDTSYKLRESDPDDINIHISYKAQLKSYKKRYFDPFRRRQKFKYYYDSYDKNGKKKWILTTIGQLNFFRWAFSNNVIDYVEKNHKNISKAMNKSNKEDKKRKTCKITKKSKPVDKIEKIININNKQVNISAKQKVKHNEVKIVLTFD